MIQLYIYIYIYIYFFFFFRFFSIIGGYKILNIVPCAILVGPYCLSILYVCCCCWVSRWATSDSFATPWTVACQASLSMGFPRQEYWSGLPFPSPGDPPNPGIEPAFSASPALSGGFFTTEPLEKQAHFTHSVSVNPRLLIYPFPSSCLVTISLISMSVSLFLFYK